MQDNSISIASSAMLVELSISAWTARKLDKKVSTQVDLDKNTKTRVGNYNKNLLAGTGFLDTIQKYASSARNWHLTQTLPWSDNGLRLLPMSNFIAYKENLATLEKNYAALVDKFVVAYPNLVSAAAFQLGDLFDREEYPDVEKVARKFKFGVNYMPVPMAGDFRIDINEEAKSGTLITFEEDAQMEQAIVSGIAFTRDEAKISIIGVPDKPGIAYKILGTVAEANIEVDMIIQNISKGGLTDFSFTVNRNDHARAIDMLKSQVLPDLGNPEVLGDAKICKVSIVGIGMRSHVGVASKMFACLSAEGINIQMISTSEIKTSVVIDEKYLELAVRALHKAFDLEQNQA